MRWYSLVKLEYKSRRGHDQGTKKWYQGSWPLIIRLRGHSWVKTKCGPDQGVNNMSEINMVWHIRVERVLVSQIKVQNLLRTWPRHKRWYLKSTWPDIIEVWRYSLAKKSTAWYNLEYIANKCVKYITEKVQPLNYKDRSQCDWLICT